jgi:hypothetical protein
MVGVAGKSRACNDCKRRRVKCGFERPGCLRCVKAGIHCSGYDKQLFFINRTSSEPSISAPIALARSGASNVPRCSIDDELDKLGELAHTSSKTVPRFRWQAFQLLQKLYLPQPAVAENDPNTGAPFSWVKAACELEDGDDVLDRALLAFCTVQVYVTGSGKTSLSQALEGYNGALSMLSNALTVQTAPRFDYILASIVVLSTCEVSVYDSCLDIR